MATSGTFTPDSTFSLLNIIEEAYERVGKEVRTGYELKSARRSLDLLTKEWSNRGVNLWTIGNTTSAVAASDTSLTLTADTIDVIDVSWRTGVGANQIDKTMQRVGVYDWSNISAKNQTGTPSLFWINRTTIPVMYFWPVPTSAGTLSYYSIRHIEDAGVYTNNMDIPPRFLPAIVSGLAYQLGLKTPGAQGMLQTLKAEYEDQFLLATDEDRERATMRLVPDLR